MYSLAGIRSINAWAANQTITRQPAPVRGNPALKASFDNAARAGKVERDTAGAVRAGDWDAVVQTTCLSS